MADNNKSIWEKVLEQVSSPWDWAAGAAGATVGVAGTFALGGSDFGASVAGGFTAGIAARKALYASLEGRRLRRRATGLMAQIEAALPSNTSLTELRDELKRELGLWESGAISNDQFSKRLDELVEKYRKAFK